MASQFGTWWQKITRHWIIVAVAILLVLIVVIVLGYLLNWHWTGLVSETSEPKQHTKTLWDWLQLLIVPLVLAIGGFWLSQIQKTTEQQSTTDNQRATVLQAYIDKMSELLLKEHLGERTANGELKPEYKQVRDVARVRTITVLTQLDARRIGYVFTFLREAGLMSRVSNDNVVSLGRADLHAVNWSQANLSVANLSKAMLAGAILNEADLLGANLFGADLSKADLSKAMLAGAILNEADLSGADLLGANLFGADLSKADLSKAMLAGANLENAIGVTKELEKQAASLQGATMPDGSKHS